MKNLVNALEGMKEMVGKIKELNNARLVDLLATINKWEQLASTSEDRNLCYKFQDLSCEVKEEILNRMK